MPDKPAKEVETPAAPAPAKAAVEVKPSIAPTPAPAPAVPAAPPEPLKVHSLEEIKGICAGIWAAHNSRDSNVDGKPWPELANGLAAVGKHGESWMDRNDLTPRLRNELALLRCATIACSDGDMESEREVAYAARGVVQIIDARA